MEVKKSPPWYAARPVPVFMIVFYCFIVLIQSGIWLVNEGFDQARQGGISILVLLNAGNCVWVIISIMRRCLVSCQTITTLNRHLV